VGRIKGQLKMKWFKFYGQDWLTDMKIMSMSMEDRLCYITLLALASSSDNNGTIKACNEEVIIRLSNIPEDTFHDINPVENARGCLKRYEALQCVTLHDNGDVTINNFQRRQNEFLSGAERQKKYRERKKKANIKDKSDILERNDSNVTQRNDSNARLDKTRLDKNIYIEKESYGELENVKLTKDEYSKLLNLLGEHNLNSLIFELDTYMASKGKRYKSHYATLLNWAKRKADKQITKGRGLAQ
jgi:hypothetical protein